MLTKQERSNGTWAGLGILVLGIVIGALARPERFLGGGGPRAPEPFHALVPPDERETPPDNGLPTLELVIPPDSAATLQRVRAAALERGIIVQDDADTVPAEVVVDGVRTKCELRIKGDWTDHVDGERWSYRVRVGGAGFMGMREFSIQDPKTRGHLWEWLLQEAARREGVLVPRSGFLNVVQNGNAMGVYFLEEHFAKELLESQGRREGPIVVWDESVLWSTLLEEGFLVPKDQRGFESALLARARTPDAARVRAYGENRLSGNENLNLALHAAVDQLKALRALALLEEGGGDARRALEAMDELRARTLDQLVDVESLGRAHALLSLFQAHHSLAWHNMRFYRDPVLARLEPVLFDNAPQVPSDPDPVPYREDSGLVAAFARSPGYVDALFTHLGRLLNTEWLEGFLADVGPALERNEAALAAEGELPPGGSAGEMRQRLRGQAAYLRRVCMPAIAAGFEAEYERTGDGGGGAGGWIDVRAWSTTLSPVVVDGFRFSNGAFTSAAEVLFDGAGAHLRGTGVVLPSDGRGVTFRFPMDERLAGLEHVEKLTRALRQELEADDSLDLDVDALHHLVIGGEPREEVLRFRRRPDGGRAAGRPPAPGVAEALERHPFLRHDAARNRLYALTGTWDVAGDLVLPTGMPLRLEGGTTLRFEQDAVLLSDAALVFEGSTREPIVLEPADGAATWQGVVVLGARERCTWRGVTVRRTTAVERGGWILTGGVTFYRSPVTLETCTFEDTQAEDGINVFGADLDFERVVFSGSRSDSFDGDFVTGELRECVFRDGAADGIDVSGSRITATNCRFERMGDKAYSIGEGSQAVIRGGSALDVSIGVASKDASLADVEGLVVQARNYALAAFVKKPVYGPARLEARDLDVRGAGRALALAQTGSAITVDGQVWPTEDVDVEASYREGILGHEK